MVLDDNLDIMEGAEPAPENPTVAMEDADPRPATPSNEIIRDKVRGAAISRMTFILKFRQTTPFLIRTFVKIGGFHHTSLFEEGKIPVSDERQLYTWYVHLGPSCRLDSELEFAGKTLLSRK